MPERTLSCAACGTSFVQSGRGPVRARCYGCAPKRKRVHIKRTPCIRCGRMSAPSDSGKCSRCRLVVKCSICGGEAHMSSKADPESSVTCRKCRSAAAKSPEEVAERHRERVRAQAKRIVGQRVCAHCGEAFPLTYRGRKKGQQFCSHECDDLAELARRAVVTCRDCGTPVSVPPSRSGRQSRCADCLVAWRNNPPKPKPIKYPSSRVYFRNCKECGTLFCTKTGQTKYCSTQCRIDVAGARANDLYALATKYNKLTGVYEGATWREALVQYIVDRDGSKCGICNRKVDITLKSGPKGSRKGPSIDHIIPRSLGGTDDLPNLRLAHWGCNQSRGNRGGNEQLALVG